ncbi:MAG TPA: hypothetical protein VMW44_00550, partial [Candidatus Bathyarchaeia archaeon]|nr:hypothetical protein [Candidatus Bathyarchaeia archaeon]
GLSGYQIDNLQSLQEAQGAPDILRPEKVVTTPEKPVTFEESQEPLTEQDLIDNRESTRRIKVVAGQALSTARGDIKSEVSRLLSPISTRLARINEKISTKVRRLEYDIGTKSSKEVELVVPLLKKTKKMNRNDAADWDYARKNSWTEVIDRLVKKYDMEKEYAAARGVLDKQRKEAIDTGLEVHKIPEYWPRRLKDPKGFLKAMGKEMDGFNDIYSRAIQEKAIELEMSVSDMSTDMKANIVSNIILGSPTGLEGISSAKKRKLKKIPARLNKFYLNSDAAIVEHIHEVRSAIEKRKFFGKIPQKVAEHRRQLQAAQKKIRELNKQLDLEPGRLEVKDDSVKKKRNEWIGRAKQHQAYINKYAKQRDYTANIGAYIDELMNEGAIDPNKQSELNDILRARFHQRGTHGFFKLYKNFSYIDTMGSPISALTQIGDSAWTLYNAGVIQGLKHIAKAIPPKKYKNVEITREDVGVSHIAQEFADPGTLGKALTWVFKLTGLEKLDAVGKESLLNASLEKYQKQAKENPGKLSSEIQKMFEGETQSVIDDLVSGEISDNVKFLAYSRLLDFQPMALSEMPERYLTSGNGRIFYMLKTFTIKQFDAFRNEAFHKIKVGDKAEKIQGIKNLIRLSMFFVLANATADELKDWILGRETDFGDRVVDNILRLAGSSKYITWKARTEGAGSAMARQVLPPFKFIDSLTKDIYNAGDDKGLEITSSIPLLGKLAYWHIGRGVSKRGDLWDRRLSQEKRGLEKIKEGLETTTDKRAYIAKHRKDLQRLKKLNSIQGRLNSYKSKMNKLKKIGGREAEIERLRKARADTIKNILK